MSERAGHFVPADCARAPERPSVLSLLRPVLLDLPRIFDAPIGPARHAPAAALCDRPAEQVGLFPGPPTRARVTSACGAPLQLSDAEAVADGPGAPGGRGFGSSSALSGGAASQPGGRQGAGLSITRLHAAHDLQEPACRPVPAPVSVPPQLPWPWREAPLLAAPLPQQQLRSFPPTLPSNQQLPTFPDCVFSTSSTFDLLPDLLAEIEAAPWPAVTAGSSSSSMCAPGSSVSGTLLSDCENVMRRHSSADYLKLCAPSAPAPAVGPTRLSLVAIDVTHDMHVSMPLSSDGVSSPPLRALKGSDGGARRGLYGSSRSQSDDDGVAAAKGKQQRQQRQQRRRVGASGADAGGSSGVAAWVAGSTDGCDSSGGGGADSECEEAAGDAAHAHAPSSGPTLEQIRSVFHLPLIDAVQVLKSSVTEVKRRCRAQGIRRWPNRKLSSLRRVEEGARAGTRLPEAVRQELLRAVELNRQQILCDPNAPILPLLKSQRQAIYRRDSDRRSRAAERAEAEAERAAEADGEGEDL